MVKTLRTFINIFYSETRLRIYSLSLSVVCGTATTNARITAIVASWEPSSRKASIWTRILSTIWKIFYLISNLKCGAALASKFNQKTGRNIRDRYHLIFEVLSHSTKCIYATILYSQVLVRSKSNKGRQNMSWSNLCINVWHLLMNTRVSFGISKRCNTEKKETISLQ